MTKTWGLPVPSRPFSYRVRNRDGTVGMAPGVQSRSAPPVGDHTLGGGDTAKHPPGVSAGSPPCSPGPPEHLAAKA